MTRISTTWLESYRRLLQTEYGSEAELLASIRYEPFEPFEPSWQMRAGTAWHSILEHPGRYQQTRHEPGSEPNMHYQCGGFVFSAEHVHYALKYTGPGVWEVKHTRVWEVDGREVEVVAKADKLFGLVISDNKTKFSPVDHRDYEPSLQWRFYLAVHGGVMFRYNLWKFLDPKPLKDRPELSYCHLQGVESFNFWPYSTLEEDCRCWLREFMSWANSRGVLLERRAA